MKRMIITFLLSVMTISSFATIINGWEKEARYAEAEIIVNQKVLDSKQYAHDKNFENILKDKIKRLEKVIEFYNITKDLLAKFKEISPELYNMMDTLKDAKNRNVDVYVKLVHYYDLPSIINGYTNLNPSSKDIDQHDSDYGENTISLKIKNNMKAIYTLAHEFGHAHYQIKHLATYRKFFSETYGDYEVEYGHKKGDLSGVEAENFEKIFEKHFKRYKRSV